MKRDPQRQPTRSAVTAHLPPSKTARERHTRQSHAAERQPRRPQTPTQTPRQQSTQPPQERVAGQRTDQTRTAPSAQTSTPTAGTGEDPRRTSEKEDRQRRTRALPGPAAASLRRQARGRKSARAGGAIYKWLFFARFFPRSRGAKKSHLKV